MKECRGILIDFRPQRYEGRDYIIAFGVTDCPFFPMKFIRHCMEWSEDGGWLVEEFPNGTEHIATAAWNKLTGAEVKPGTVVARQWTMRLEAEQW